MEESNSVKKYVNRSMDRIQQLENRLEDLHHGLEMQRAERTDQVRKKLESIDNRLQTAYNVSSKRFLLMKEKLSTCLESLNAEKINRENKFQLIESKLMQTLQDEQKRRRESELNLLKNFEERINSLKEEYNRKGKDHGDDLHLQKHFDAEIKKLQELVYEEMKDREVIEQRIMKETSEEIGRLTSILTFERAAREESATGMLELIEKVVMRVQDEIKQEKQERETMEDSLIQLIENTMSRLNSSCEF